MKHLIVTALLITLLSIHAEAADGLINVQSTFTVTETADRMENVLKEKGMTVFNRIKHSENAQKVGLKLNDTELIIFGNPKVGTPLMKCQQSVAIDLPQKALIWEDDNDAVWISYNNPKYLEKRHNISGCEEVISKIEKALVNITRSTTTQ